jgi:hypothetical protein
MTDERLSTRDIADDRPRAADPKVVDATAPAVADDTPPMFAGDEATGFRTRWDAIQTGFVDEPRKAVEEADALVAQVMKRLAEVFADEREDLERQWDRGEQISTEDLRMALRRYRSFFHRLLSV